MGAMAVVGTTVYDIRIDYKLNDKASAGIKSMGVEAKKLGDVLGGLKSVVGLVGAGLLFREGAKALIGFNADLDKMRIQLGGIISMNMGKPFAQASQEADALFLRFQEAAKKSPAMTKDFIEMSSGIAAAAAQAGMGLNQLHDLTVGAVTAATVFGMRGDIAALDVTQMLQGAVSVKDRMARALLASQGITDHTAFNKMEQKDRASVVMRALNDPKLKDAAESFGASFSGQWSTLADQIQIALGKVGLPLFREVTKEITSWNQWIERNPEAIKNFAKEVGGGLVDAFRMLKDVISTIIAHKDTLLLLGKIWAVKTGMSLAGGLANSVTGGAGGLAGLFTGPVRQFNGAIGAMTQPAATFATGLKTAATSMTGMIGAVGQLAGALGMVYLAAQAFASWVDEKQESDLNKRAAVAGQVHFANRFLKTQGAVDSLSGQYRLADGADKGAQRTAIEAAVEKRNKEVFGLLMSGQETGLIGFDGGKPVSNFDTGPAWQAAKERLIALGMHSEEAGKTLMATEQALRLAKDGIVSVNWASLDPVARAAAAEEERKRRNEEMVGKTTAPMNLNVKIEKIEVTSDDPDRFVYGMVNAFEEAVQNPGQASGAIRSIGG